MSVSAHHNPKTWRRQRKLHKGGPGSAPCLTLGSLNAGPYICRWWSGVKHIVMMPVLCVLRRPATQREWDQRRRHAWGAVGFTRVRINFWILHTPGALTIASTMETDV